ncbi:MAG: Rv0909 family putative TA system antitoxin [Microbacterium sp.]|uniref:Rv0909 family putative TA system antitoxin n=1 Tax=Microbacterium sp. TaxID=51671 RepID=UPI0039E65E26
MGIDDIVNQGKELFEQNKEKVEEFLKSDQVEDISDKVLDGAADLAKKVLPDEHDAAIDGVRDNVDGAVGDQ